MGFGFYLMFLCTGMVIGAFLGWRFMQRQWSDKPIVTKGDAGWLAALLAILMGGSQ